MSYFLNFFRSIVNFEEMEFEFLLVALLSSVDFSVNVAGLESSFFEESFLDEFCVEVLFLFDFCVE